MPGLSVTGVRLVVPDHTMGFPVLRALSLCVHAAATTPAQRLCSHLLNPTAVSVFPDRVVGSTCASSFSRLARRSLALRPAHSRRHQFVTLFTRRLQPYRYLHDRSGCFRLEPWPGGVLTHRKAPLFHGAHPKRNSKRSVSVPESVRSLVAARLADANSAFSYQLNSFNLEFPAELPSLCHLLSPVSSTTLTKCL